MNTTVQALQALYVKLGGTLVDSYDDIANGAPVGDYTTIPDMIEACTQKAGSSGGSGDGSFLVTMTQGTGSDYEADKTADEIYSAWQDGIPVYLVYDGMRIPLVSASYDEKYSFAANITVLADGFTSLLFNAEMNSANATTWEFSSFAANSLPSVSDSDNGKVLKVVDGEWKVAEDATE